MAVAEGYVTAARNAEVVASASILSGLDSSAKTALDSVSSEFDLYHKAFQQVLRIAEKVVSSIILDRLSKLIPPEPVAPVSIAAAAVDDTPSPTPQPPPVPIKSPKKKVQKKKAVGTGSGAGEATIVEVEATDSPIPESPAVPIDDSEAVIKQLLSAMTDKDKELDIAKATVCPAAHGQVFLLCLSICLMSCRLHPCPLTSPPRGNNSRQHWRKCTEGVLLVYPVIRHAGLAVFLAPFAVPS